MVPEPLRSETQNLRSDVKDRTAPGWLFFKCILHMHSGFIVRLKCIETKRTLGSINGSGHISRGEVENVIFF